MVVLEVIPNLFLLSLVNEYHVLELILLFSLFAWRWLILLT